jgi:hypothetical protein
MRPHVAEQLEAFVSESVTLAFGLSRSTAGAAGTVEQGASPER